MTRGRNFGLMFVEVLDDEALDTLALRLAPRLLDQRHATSTGWLDARAAAEHLGITLNALHKLTASRAVPFHQDGPGCKLWFLREDLDDWRRREGSRSVPNASTALPQPRSAAS